MKKVNVQYFCDCCGEQITDEVKALMEGKIDPANDGFAREDDIRIRHYHDSCLANILQVKPPTKKRLTTEG